jgi:acetolactate synthase I/II/III large subunit
VRSFCSRHHVAAMVTYKAKGVVRDDDVHFAGVFTNAAIEQPILNQADLLIGVGLDPVELLPRTWTYTQPLIGIERFRVEGGHVPFVAHLVSDVAAGLQQLSQCLVSADWNLDEVRGAIAAQRELMQTTGAQLTADGVIRIAAIAAPDARVTVDAGAHMFAATMLWPVAEPNGMLISNGLSTMGFALPAAIGASLLDRRRPVVALTGDGGLLICLGELLTAAREHLPVVTIVFSDASLSLIAVKQQQRRLVPAGVALGDVAWCALAESLGVSAQSASTEAELRHALSRSLERRGPSLIEARIDPSDYAHMVRTVRG